MKLGEDKAEEHTAGITQKTSSYEESLLKKVLAELDRYSRSKIEMAKEDLGSIAYIQKTLDNLDAFRFVKMFRPFDGCFGACHAGNVG